MEFSLKISSLLVLLLVVVSATAKKGHHKEKGFHQQVHLSLGRNETEMVVTWATLESCNHTVVEFGTHENKLDVQSQATETGFFRNATLFTHRALMQQLKADHTYYYRVGSEESGWSDVFEFRTLKSGNNWNPKLLVYGDLGYKNDVSLKYLRKEFNKFDAIFHIGDFAYDLHDDFGEKGNKFMNEIQPVTSRIGYMTCAGNHEKHDNYSHYEARFSMLADEHQIPTVDRVNNEARLAQATINNQYYSRDIGLAHIVMFSTELYYYTQFGYEQIAKQFEWLEQDLKRANQNREKTPWIIVMGHRPFYTVKKCPQPECDEHNQERPKIRQGIHMYNRTEQPLQYGLEKLFYDNGVDLMLFGHEHLYARLLPVYNFQPKSGHNKSNPYSDALAPITLITGSAGNKEEHPEVLKKQLPFVVHQHTDYGYTRLLFQSRHHIVVEQTSDDQGGAVVDRFEILKSSDQPKWFTQK